VALDELERRATIPGTDDRVALLLEVEADQLHDVALVVHDQDRLHPREDTMHAPGRRPAV
jgi:hypothetical protein